LTATITAVADEEGDAQNDIVWISVTKDGYTPYVEQPYVAPDMETPIVIHLEVAPEVPEVLPPEPPEEVTPPPIDVAALPELTTRGHCLQTNTWWTAVQCSDFNLLARFQAGEDITPVLADPLYGRPSKDPLLCSVAEELGHQALHARVLGFVVDVFDSPAAAATRDQQEPGLEPFQELAALNQAVGVVFCV
jgi:hypothetical protein